MDITRLSLPITIILFTFQIHAQMPKVHTVGAMNKMGNTYDLNIWLDTISKKSHLYGMGPYDKMKGEITIVNGKPYHASALVEGEYELGKNWNIRSPFFVYANVKNWEVFRIEGDFKSVDDIQAKVASVAAENGYDVSQPFAFRVKGDFDALTAHIVTPRNPEISGYRDGVKSQKFSFRDTKGEIVGIYSEEHQGIFTGSNSFVHVHFLMKNKKFMGHLDEIQTKGKTFKLFLPKID